MGIEFARSATRHRISRASASFVVEHAGDWIEQAPVDGSPNLNQPRLLFLGDDALGQPLEVGAVQLNDQDLLIIHAMRLRPKFQPDYEEVKKWRI